VRLRTRGTVGGHGGIDTTCSRFGDDTAPGSSAGRLGATHSYSPGCVEYVFFDVRAHTLDSSAYPLRTADSDLREPISQRPRGRPVLGAVGPQDLHQARPVVLVITVTAVTTNPQHPLGLTL
jgi:hypothetical protein